MLKNTFLHIPRIGYKTEKKLWKHGFISWQDYLEKCDSCPVHSLPKEIVVNHIETSAKALAHNNARYFEERLNAGDAWRFYADFRNSVAFVDIETTGLYSRSDAITVVGLFDGRSTKVFIQGRNLQDFGEEVKKYSLLVTFNGKRFDLPFIRSVFGELPPLQGHIDLLYPLRQFGYRGGLKSIERQIGLEREGSLKKADGYLAVLLWREHVRGNKTALNTLIRYNLEDVVNLQYLADWVYNEGTSRLPIHPDRLPTPSKYDVDAPFDEELVEYLSRAIEEQRFNRSY